MERQTQWTLRDERGFVNLDSVQDFLNELSLDQMESVWELVCEMRDEKRETYGAS